MALAFETTYGAPPVGGFTKMPFASTSLGAEQPLLNSELLGYGRDPLAPIKDAVTAHGDVVVPLDAEAFGFERRISIIPDLELGQIENRFEGAATAATTAAQSAFDRAFEDNPLTAPDLGLTAAASTALATTNTYRGAARDLAKGARAPLANWQALRDAVRGSNEDGADALTEATGAAERFETVLGDAGRAATGAGTAAGAAAAAAQPDAEAVITGWQAVTAALSDYASKARDIGGDIWSATLVESCTSCLKFEDRFSSSSQ